jgi:hypothetical protein
MLAHGRHGYLGGHGLRDGHGQCPHYVRIIPVEPFAHPPLSGHDLDETSAPADPLELFDGWLAAVGQHGMCHDANS